MTTIPVFKPLIEREERQAADDVLVEGWLGMGASVREFEEALHELLDLGERQVVAVSTGHAALHLSLLLLGVGPGDEVITASFNNAADFQAILAVGAQPVFCDIDDATLCIRPELIPELVTERTKALIAMDYGLHLCDHTAMTKTGDALGLPVLHDAAHSLGSRFEGAPISHQAELTTFSFDPVKTITSIDGGAIVVRDAEQVDRLHAMRLIGMNQPSSVMYQNQRAWTYDIGQLGFRYHLANLHAAIGTCQLRKFTRITQRRREVVQRYQEAFGDLEAIATPGPLGDDIVPFLYYLRVPAGRRDDFRAHLSSQQVDTGIHWNPGHWFSLFREARRGPLDVTEQVGNEIVTIPLHSDMTDETVARVVESVRSFPGA